MYGVERFGVLLYRTFDTGYDPMEWRRKGKVEAKYGGAAAARSALTIDVDNRFNYCCIVGIVGHCINSFDVSILKFGGAFFCERSGN